MKKVVIGILLIASAVYSSDLLIASIHLNDHSHAPALISRINNEGGVDKNLYLGIVYHNLARETQVNYLAMSLQYLRTAYREHPSGIVKAYLGSAITLEGNIYSKRNDVIIASAKVEEGTKLIDEAVSSSPNDTNLRFIRIGNAIGVSEASPFKRYDVARKDIDFIAKKIDSLDRITQSLYYFYAGKVARADNRINEALKYFELSISQSPDSFYAKESRKMLHLLEE